MNIVEELEKINNAIYPEDLFGEDPDKVKFFYRDFCKRAHEDLFTETEEKRLAHEAFVALGVFYQEAEDKIAAGTYGDRTIIKSFSVDTKKSKYNLNKVLYSGAVSDIYLSDKNCLFKLCRNYLNNDLLKNEAEKVGKLRKSIDDPKILQHIPNLIDSCSVPTGSEVLAANVFENPIGFITLQDIINAYPDGIDPRDMAWMFNRTMNALFLAHSNKVVHGAINPNHILINIETHNAILIDWCYSVNAGERLKAIDSEYKDFYPQEVFLKQPAKLNLDLYMLALSIVKLLGGNIEKKTLPKSVPREIKNLLNSCLLGYNHRSGDVFELYKDFSEILKALYGPRKFRTFVMPEKK